MKYIPGVNVISAYTKKRACEIVEVLTLINLIFCLSGKPADILINHSLFTKGVNLGKHYGYTHQKICKKFNFHLVKF